MKEGDLGKVCGTYRQEKAHIEGADGESERIVVFTGRMAGELGKDMEEMLMTLLWHCHCLPGGTEEDHQNQSVWLVSSL
jgi:hypothetical protein